MIDVVVENNLYMENFLKRKPVDVTLPSPPLQPSPGGTS